MKLFLLELLLKVLKSDMTKELIGLSVNKLLNHTEDGITKDVATTMIEGIAKSKMNPATGDMFTDVLKVLGK
jgi:hypothetical protein